MQKKHLPFIEMWRPCILAHSYNGIYDLLKINCSYFAKTVQNLCGERLYFPPPAFLKASHFQRKIKWKMRKVFTLSRTSNATKQSRYIARQIDLGYRYFCIDALTLTLPLLPQPTVHFFPSKLLLLLLF